MCNIRKTLTNSHNKRIQIKHKFIHTYLLSKKKKRATSKGRIARGTTLIHRKSISNTITRYRIYLIHKSQLESDLNASS